MNIIKVFSKPQLYVKLFKVDQTEHLWVFTFRDSINKFLQSVIIDKRHSWEATCSAWEKIHEVWRNELEDKYR